MVSSGAFRAPFSDAMCVVAVSLLGESGIGKKQTTKMARINSYLRFPLTTLYDEPDGPVLATLS